MRSSSKSAIINTFEKEVPLVHILSKNTVKIFHTMVLIQQLPIWFPTKTFGDISDFILGKIMHPHAMITCLVSDQYDHQSIKYPERADRAADVEVQYAANRRNQSMSVQF